MDRLYDVPRQKERGLKLLQDVKDIARTVYRAVFGGNSCCLYSPSIRTLLSN